MIRTTVKDLLEANPGVDPRRLKLGYKLVVPSGTALLAGKSEPAKTQESPTNGKIYEVKAGDSLSAIARTHGVSLSNLRNANNIRSASETDFIQRVHERIRRKELQC